MGVDGSPSGSGAVTLTESRAVDDFMCDELSPNEVVEGMTVELEWSPKRAGSGDTVEGEVTRVWRPEDDVREFTVREAEETDWNVYTEYRNPPSSGLTSVRAIREMRYRKRRPSDDWSELFSEVGDGGGRWSPVLHHRGRVIFSHDVFFSRTASYSDSNETATHHGPHATTRLRFSLTSLVSILVHRKTNLRLVVRLRAPRSSTGRPTAKTAKRPHQLYAKNVPTPPCRLLVE
ncbi:hypothetical protein [Haladaptatus pallidirubidus]|uniref:hypothetical protein n=1 Tax=Haladaptatus pallidirubidus TaxID=1008152 RepID=UPI0036F21DF0